MLQEVNCTENTNSMWSSEWGNQTILVPMRAIKQ